METNQNLEENSKETSKENSKENLNLTLKGDLKFLPGKMTLKILLTGMIILMFIIPREMIVGLVREREATAEQAKREVMDKWSLEQSLRGPVLSIPYIQKSLDKDNKAVREIHECHFLPEVLTIDGEIFPKKLYRSIYQPVVYNSSLKITGRFVAPDFEALKIDPADILWERARLSVAISDLRGISENVYLTWNGKSHPFSPGMDNKLLGKTGISVQLPVSGTADFPEEFQFDLDLKGSNQMNFSPLGKTTEVNMRSDWDAPGFQGRFLPIHREVTEKGFEASWKVLHFNRNFPQQWKRGNYDLHDISDADFGVELVSVAGHYQKSYRSAQYSIMVIILIFLSFYLNEMISGQRIHPFQYILVGFAILIFYLLLLSFSEHIGFNKAYLISAFLVSGLVLAYSRTFLRTWMNSILLTSILVMSLGFMFVLMQLESYALLTGSIGLFIVLALTMFFTRKINWYNE